MPKFSAGLLLYRVSRDGGVECLLVHPGGPFWVARDEHAWSIPKGEYEEGEDPYLAARREFQEEIGTPPPDGPPYDLGEVRQGSGKRVRAWAVEAGTFVLEEISSNEFELEWPPRSGQIKQFPEVDRAEWVAEPRVRALLVKGQLPLVDRLVSWLASPH